MEPPRFLRCIGYPTLYSPVGEAVRFRTKKHLALLVYLAIESRQTHRRDRLAELFWPKVPLAEARHSLATALSILRPRVGPGAIQATRDHVRFDTTMVLTDVEQLLTNDLQDPPVNNGLEIAAFLEGFDILDSREFAHWKDRVQARLLPRVTRAFSQLVDRCRRRGETRQIEYLANRMLALDELCEEAVRAKMEALALAGDRLAALRLFEEWRHKVNEELSASPSEQLTAIAAQLRKRGWERTPVADLPSRLLDQCRHTFVGRSGEYNELYEAWEDIRTNRRAHVMVLGDSGVGKTTLVDRFTAAAGLEGAAVSRVQCYDLEREIPYSAVSGLVIGLLDRPEALGTPPEALAELSRIAPQLRQKFSAIPAPKETHGETARIELTEALHQLIEAITELTPVILVVDDLHLADDASLAVLHLLVRRSLDKRTMLIMIARPGELAVGSQGRLFRDLGSMLGVRELVVQPLNEDESSELLTRLLEKFHTDPPKHVRKALIEASGGYPMALELLAQDWRANGGKSLGHAIDAMTVDIRSPGRHSEAYQRAVNRLARSMDPASKTVLYMASLLGSRLNDLAMYNLANLSLGQTMAGLAQLTELRLLRDGTRGLEFINELVRAEVYSSIPSTVRKALHGAIADRLLAEEGGSARSSGLEIAWHCLRAGRQEQAIPHLIRGATQALRQGAPHVAERALESAMITLQGHDASIVRLLLAEAMQEQGRWRESLDVLRELSASESQDLQWWGSVLAAIAKRNLGASLSEEARADIPLLNRILRDSSDARMRVSAARTITHFASVDRDAMAARTLLPLVSAISRDQLDDETKAQLALTRGLLLWLTGNVKASYAEVEEAVEVLHQKGIANIVAVQLTLGLGSLRTHQGKYADALAHYNGALDMAKRLGNDTQLASILGNLALCYGRLGDYDEQLRLSIAAPRTWGAEFGGLVELQLTYCEALSLTMLGREEEAQTAIELLDRRLHGALPVWMKQAWFLWKADLLLCAGKHENAYSVAQCALDSFGAQLHSAAFAGPFARWLSHLGSNTTFAADAKKALSSLVCSLATFDALDQVEVLCAADDLGVNARGDKKGYQRTIEERLELLPGEIRAHLIRLGSIH